MQWYEGLSHEQRAVAEHLGSHAVLIAGPGTGKTRTLTARIIRLCKDHQVKPSDILMLTFTRAAAALLRRHAREALGDTAELPEASTLHSYSLSQLVLSGSELSILPTPIRMADNWEERNIIWEDLKRTLNMGRIKDVKELFGKLSADWQTLAADQEGWEQTFPNPHFVAAWRNHRQIYGYTLRDELVYQLKRATEQVPGFTLPRRPRYLLVDEYQDLNRCDLAVVRATCDQGAELFAAGDDDQSIYGFRHAFPLGIRRFDDDYPLATHLELSECYRCQSPILDFAQFVADLDIRRLQKSTHSACASAPSEVRLLAFPNETAEAAAVARICQHLLSAHGILPGEVLILLRSDHNQAFSSVLAQAIRDRNLPVSVRLVPERPTDHDSGRILLAFMRLATSTEESLSWRTLIKLRNNGIGDETIERLHEIADQQHRNLYAILQMVKRSPDILGSSGGRVAAEVVSIETALNEVGRPPDTGEVPPVVEWVARLGKLVLTDLAEQERIAGFLGDVIAGTDCSSIPRLLGVLSLPDETIEQETDPDAINIMTMHKAKGLSAEVVFVVGAEDEYVPGRNVEGPLMLDELRLLYVSLTRTRNRLYVTYCGQRRGQQMRTGRTPSTPRRTLTRFLQDGPIHAENGIEFASTLPT